MSEVTKNKSIISKGQMFSEILPGIRQQLEGLNSPKKMLEKFDEIIATWQPSGRGRSGPKNDMVVLQQIVDKLVNEYPDNKNPVYFAGRAAYLYNSQTDAMNTGNFIDPNKVKQYVLAGKIKFPEGVVFPPKVPKPRKVANEVV